jgi:amino acid transporter/mannitol/fructose-specific phosphotransferase system IIA component (Ntr-type)
MTERRLKKHLNLPGVFALSIGPMLASGLFLLPALVFHQVGPAAILAYFISGLLLIPALLSQAELATAMPRAGGTYYFLDRSLGPMVGTIAGAGTWLALIFKSAFDLIGLGAYLVLFLNLPVKPVALALCVLFAGLSISGVRNVARIQIILVSMVLASVAYFIVKGFFAVEAASFQPLFSEGSGSLLGAVGIVYIGFTGLTKVASVAEEVDDLERAIPLAMIYALGITILIYVLGMIVMIGVMDPLVLSSTQTPVADAAERFLGQSGLVLMSIVAIVAFIASANAGLTAASRYPLAMGRDSLVPSAMAKIGRFHTPTNGILITIGLMIIFILVLSVEEIAKLASTFQLLLFGLLNLAVIVMRESQIPSYDPGFRSRLYPWMQVVGILTPVILIPALGILSVITAGVIITISFLWYFFYARQRVTRASALHHVFERMGRSATTHLDQELRQILREKGLRREDIFENSIARANVIRHKPGVPFEDVLWQASTLLAKRMEISAGLIFDSLSASNQRGETPIADHVALPHTRLDEVGTPELVIVHSTSGVRITGSDEKIYALFILVGPKDDPGQHLRFLAELANRSDGIDYAGEWLKLEDDESVRQQFLRSGTVLEIELGNRELVGREIREIQMHEACLVALITRGEKMVIPHGKTKLLEGDLLTLIGDQDAVEEMIELFCSR